MGAWGYGAFDDDTALDFLDALDTDQDVTAHLQDLLTHATSPEPLTYTVAVSARAVIALLAEREQPGIIADDTGREYSHTLACTMDNTLRDLAVRALDRILDPHHNEWHELSARNGLLEPEIHTECASYRSALAGKQKNSP
ncbi:DUF4259 domain-containing protein [Nocardia sp. AG03]|uniref:DUF4259 domain-containing protein n=1 Tax=Nocardia sp. AG03 TaxID=3025312 RepID=UPI00241832DC|nr:DUF4259 domain-containing protein [Nocardia sp. AG03]